MGRRRKKPPHIFDLFIGILVLIFVLLVTAGGFNFKSLDELVGRLQFCFFLALGLTVGGIVLFFAVRTLIRATPPATPRNASAFGSAATSNPLSSAPRRRGTFVLPPFVPPAAVASPIPAAPVSLTAKLRATDWYQFERVVSLIYECDGYAVHRRGGAKPDGGIDLVIEKNGERTAVQCKRWKTWEVKEPLIREMLGAMTHAGLAKGVVVALNGFTHPAKQLAIQHNIDIVHDENLATIIGGLAPAAQLKIHAMLDDDTKHCPKCEATMLWRAPKAGKSWTPFWGCSRHPQCHGRLRDD